MIRSAVLAIMVTLFSASATGKSLVVYFSHDDAVGEVASYISGRTSSVAFRIEPKDAYPTDAMLLEKRQAMEVGEDLRPELAADRSDAADFDALILVVPLWRDTVPQAVATFLSSHDFSGRRIAPVVVSRDASRGQTVERVEELCPNVDVTDCLPLVVSDGWKIQVDAWLSQVDAL